MSSRMQRKSLSKKTRFEVFKRDSFTCQYCGAKSPDVVLHVDHVEPVAAGGSDSLLNLVTSCSVCNSGKGATPLDDASAVEKQRQQLEQLQERREQLDMMLDWQKGLQNIDDYATEKLAEFWGEQTPGWSVNDTGKKKIQRLVTQYGVDGVMNAMRISAAHYVELQGEPPVATRASQAMAWSKIHGIASVREAEKTKPYLKKLLWIRGILRNRCSYYFSDRIALQQLEEAVKNGVPLEELESIAKGISNWTGWQAEFNEVMDRCYDGAFDR